LSTAIGLTPGGSVTYPVAVLQHPVAVLQHPVAVLHTRWQCYNTRWQCYIPGGSVTTPGGSVTTPGGSVTFTKKLKEDFSTSFLYDPCIIPVTVKAVPVHAIKAFGRVAI